MLLWVLKYPKCRLALRIVVAKLYFAPASSWIFCSRDSGNPINGRKPQKRTRSNPQLKITEETKRNQQRVTTLSLFRRGTKRSSSVILHYRCLFHLFGSFFRPSYTSYTQVVEPKYKGTKKRYYSSAACIWIQWTRLPAQVRSQRFAQRLIEIINTGTWTTSWGVLKWCM